MSNKRVIQVIVILLVFFGKPFVSFGYFSDITEAFNSNHNFYYGNDSPALAKTATVEQSLTWQGRYADPTGFYIMGERYFDHRGGRFLSADSLGHAASMDLYSYSGDPINFFDPTGRLRQTGIDATGKDAGFDFSTPASSSSLTFDEFLEGGQKEK